jgi:hypothetical protein
MAAKKKTQKTTKKPLRRQPVVAVHHWFNPFHAHIHANLRRWLLITGAIVILVAGSTIFD